MSGFMLKSAQLLEIFLINHEKVTKKLPNRQFSLDGNMENMVKISNCVVLRIHGSWARPDALSGLEQSWSMVMRQKME